MNYKEEKVGGVTVYDGKILKVNVDKVRLGDGSLSTREEVVHNGGVGVLTVKDGKVLLVKQFRYSYGEEVIEIPAGKLELAEDPLFAGIRELEEETGIKAKSLKKLGCIYPSPGYTNEKIYIFLCEDFTVGEQKLDEGEFLSYYWQDLKLVYEQIKKGEIMDAKTVCALLEYGKYYER